MVHPALEPILRAAHDAPVAHPSTVSIADRRLRYLQVSAQSRHDVEPVESVTDLRLALDGRDLAARLYVPNRDEGKALIVYFHGGGFVVGDLDSHDGLCRRISADTRMRLLAVDYRLAPEHPFPAAVDDAVDTVRAVARQIERFDAPDARLIVMGDSAGATLAAVACALTKDEHLGVVAQVLIYPTLGPELFTDSAHAYATGHLLELDHLRYDYAQYLGDWSDHTDPRVCPLMFPDLAGAPAAVVVVAQFDPLRDEGVAYAGLLEHFGVGVELLEAEGMVHGFLRLGASVPEALSITDDLAEHMHRYVEEASA